MSRELQYFALPTEPCADVVRDVPHMAHVHTSDGVKSVCAGVLPHSVPMANDPVRSPICAYGHHGNCKHDYCTCECHPAA